LMLAVTCAAPMGRKTEVTVPPIGRDGTAICQRAISEALDRCGIGLGRRPIAAGTRSDDFRPSHRRAICRLRWRKATPWPKAKVPHPPERSPWSRMAASTSASRRAANAIPLRRGKPNVPMPPRDGGRAELTQSRRSIPTVIRCPPSIRSGRSWRSWSRSHPASRGHLPKSVRQK